jgi:hypothetical protein
MAKFIGERLDTGGSVEFVTVEKDYYEQAGTEFLTPIYDSETALESQPRFNAKTARLLINMLYGQVFTEDGMLTELLAPVNDFFSGDYQADDNGSVLYNADGDEIGTIYYASVINGEPYRISIWTKDDIERQLGYNSTYEEAVALLGRDFRLPAVYTEELDPPEFQLTSFLDDAETEGSAPYEVKWVSARYSGFNVPNMFFTIENIRKDHDVTSPTSPWYVPDGVIEESEIAGIKVYKIYSNADYYNDFIIYSWEHDGLSYIFNSISAGASFTDEQCENIIRSMIE